MKKLISLTVLLSLTSCASMAPISYQEQCALKGMALTGVTESNGTESATAYNWTTHQSATAHSNSFSENVSCRVPVNQEEKCEVDHLARAAMPKAEYNEGYNTKRSLTGWGYFLFVIPGVALKLTYDDQLNKAVAKSQELAQQKSCGPKPASLK